MTIVPQYNGKYKKYIKIGKKFGNWRVISTSIIKNRSDTVYVRCKDERNNQINWVCIYHLINGSSTGSRQYRKVGISNRSKNLDLPIYVHPFLPDGRWRVLKKEKGNVLTYLYTHDYDEACILANWIEKNNK